MLWQKLVKGYQKDIFAEFLESLMKTIMVKLIWQSSKKWLNIFRMVNFKNMIQMKRYIYMKVSKNELHFKDHHNSVKVKNGKLIVTKCHLGHQLIHASYLKKELKVYKKGF